MVSDMRVLGSARNALKLKLRDKTGLEAEGIIFGDADAMREEISGFKYIDILYSPEINVFRGTESIQMSIKGYREKMKDESV